MRRFEREWSKSGPYQKMKKIQYNLRSIEVEKDLARNGGRMSRVSVIPRSRLGKKSLKHQGSLGSASGRIEM